ncbi:MAG TPA: bifunctional riboflavin kinase/FAD synthetase [Candidatus Dormibacteraeota bacterium]|nr:bifunctional riboflavin kinase/FAD synthetase [Candidatus Dormibacteraeota bacterium]
MRVQFGLAEDGAGDPHDRRAVVLTIGNYDGVHLGHRSIIESLVENTRALRGESVVVTFDPHPRCVLDPENCPSSLTTLDEKRDLLTRLGVDRLVVLEFTRALSRWSAEHFCAELGNAFPTLGRMVVGYDFALGHNRRGDIAFLRNWGSAHGFDVVAVEAQQLNGEVVSSSAIRRALLGGDVAAAARLLGRPYFFDSWVQRGAQRGTRLGFSTANLAITPNKCLPMRGIYAMWILVQGEWQAAATSVGYNPTFGGDHLTVEAYLLDFAGDIYRERLRAAFVARLRDERAFGNVEALAEQIAKDVTAARRQLRRTPAPIELT